MTNQPLVNPTYVVRVGGLTRTKKIIGKLVTAGVWFSVYCPTGKDDEERIIEVMNQSNPVKILDDAVLHS